MRLITVEDITDGKRAWGLVISSGRNRLWLETASAGSKYGSVKTPGVPSRGNDVIVKGTSLGLRCFRARQRLYIGSVYAHHEVDTSRICCKVADTRCRTLWACSGLRSRSARNKLIQDSHPILMVLGPLHA